MVHREQHQQDRRITTSGVVTNEYPIPSGSDPEAITAGPEGNLWFALFSDKIGKITTAGVFTEYSVTTGSGPRGITAGPDGALWFTEYSAAKIGRITTSGILTNEYTIPNGNASSPTDIAAGPDGALWFVEQDGNNIGRITTAGVFSQSGIITNPATPSGIAVATDHSLWFNERFGNKTGRLGLVNYNRTVSASPSAGGTVSAANGTFLFLALSSQTVTATANPGYQFKNWTMDGSVVSTSASYTFTLAGNFSPVANFSRNSTSHDFNGDG